MAEIRSAHRLMQEYQRHVVQTAELRRLLRERLDTARTELDRLRGGTDGEPAPGAAPESPAVRKRPLDVRIERLRREIAEIEWAIERMDRGRYGTCRRCCALLPLEELRRAPHKQECAACQEHHRMPA